MRHEYIVRIDVILKPHTVSVLIVYFSTKEIDNIWFIVLTFNSNGLANVVFKEIRNKNTASLGIV